MKHFMVFQISRAHVAVLSAVLLAAAALAAVWPRPVYGGEGGYVATYEECALPGGVRAAAPDDAGVAKLAIIIDDFGQGRDGVRQMMAIDRRLTFAVMPFCTYTDEDAEEGWRRGHEIIVHLPMEPMRGQPEWLGSNPILCSQESDKISSIARMALLDVPHAVGANVHMGSKASADDRVMRCILSEVAEAGLYFVDSRTGARTVIAEVAAELGVPCLSRNVFLDGQRPKSHIVGQLREAQRIALKTGSAVAIGHVGIEGGKPTAEAIAEMLDEFDRNGVQLVFVSELLGYGVRDGANGT